MDIVTRREEKPPAQPSCGAEPANSAALCLLQVGCEQLLAHTDPVRGLAALVGELLVPVCFFIECPASRAVGCVVCGGSWCDPDLPLGHLAPCFVCWDLRGGPWVHSLPFPNVPCQVLQPRSPWLSGRRDLGGAAGCLARSFPVLWLQQSQVQHPFTGGSFLVMTRLSSRSCDPSPVAGQS